MAENNESDAHGPRAAAANLSDQDNASAPISGKTAANIESLLFGPMATSYRPSLPIYSARNVDWHSLEFYTDVEAMRRDAAVSLPLDWVMGPLVHSEWEIEGRTVKEAQFMAKQIQWFWSNAVGRTQEESYCWGWCPGELSYGVQDGLLVQDRYDTFAARDADPLVKDGKPVGIRVRNTENGSLDLHGWREDVPNKGFWYAHRAPHGLRRGRSQIRPAWRPWRRLMGRDGAEEIIDLGVYRHGIGSTVVDHPNKIQKTVPSAAPSFAQNGEWHTRDEARSIAESAKGGAGIAVSSETDGKGARLWDYRVLNAGVNVEQLISYVEYLERLCSKAVGVPPELFQAAQTGSGYSGRAIPLQAFLVAQQRPLDDLTREWVNQVGLPMLRWNFGPNAWARITPVPLIESYRKSAWDKPGGSSVAMPQAPAMGGPGGFAPPGGGAVPQPPPTATMATDVDFDDLDGLESQMAGMTTDEITALARSAGVDVMDDVDAGELV